MKLTQKAQRAEQQLAAAPVVILVRPQLGENVGLTARAMLNFGLHELRLVAPRCGWPNAKAVAAAAGAYPVLNRVHVVPQLRDAIADLQYLYATTAHRRELDKPTLTAAQALQEAVAAIDAGYRVGLLFGPERTGLSNEDLALADAIVTIPTNPFFPSLNLAQAVLICGYEWWQRRVPTPATAELPARERLATKGELAALLAHLLRELEAARFFRSQDARESLVRRIEVMCARRPLTLAEVNLLHGIIARLAQARRTGTPSETCPAAPPASSGADDSL